MRYLVLLIVLITSFHVDAQDLSYLKGVRLKSKSDFIAHEVDAIKAIDHLLSTSIDDEGSDRSACKSFLYRYAHKTPFVTVELKSPIIAVFEGNIDLLLMYLGLYVKSAIEDKERSEFSHGIYAMDELYAYCKAGNGVNETTGVRSLITAGDNDDLVNWVKKLQQ